MPNIIAAPYDERNSRLHVRRVREIIGMSFLYSSLSPSVFSYYNLHEDEEQPKVFYFQLCHYLSN